MSKSLAARRYSLENIHAQRTKLAADVKSREQRIVKKWETITERPTLDSKFSLYANRAEAAYQVYDGFMMGYKLLRIFRRYFPKSRSKRKTRKE